MSRVARDRYAQCDDTCTTDCGACKGAGRPVTDADRAKAAELSPHETWCCGDGCCGCDSDCGASARQDAIAAALAAALAAERAAAADLRARVLTLAEEWEAHADRHDDAEPVSSEGLTRMILAARHCREHAARLRAAVTGTSEENR